MLTFRWHRHTLDESLATAVKVNTFSELHQLVEEKLSQFIEVKKEDITIKYYCFDDRINQETYLVTLKDYGVLGMINGDLMKMLSEKKELKE